jgi:hypothetical protein
MPLALVWKYLFLAMHDYTSLLATVGHLFITSILGMEDLGFLGHRKKPIWHLLAVITLCWKSSQA